MSITEVSDKIGVARQNVHQWISGARKIPQKYLPQLSEFFDLPEDLFDKEFNEIDKLRVQSLELDKEIKKSKVVFERDIFDATSRKWISIEETHYNENAIGMQRTTDAEIVALELIEKIKQDIFDVTDDIECTEDYISQVSSATDQYKRFLDLRRNNKISEYTLERVLRCLAKLPELKISVTDIDIITDEEFNNFDFDGEFERLLLLKKKMDMYRQKQLSDLRLMDEENQELY